MAMQKVTLRLVLFVGLLQGLITVVRSECTDGVCVPLAECKDYHVEDLISIRLDNSECDHYLDVCCDPENKTDKPNLGVVPNFAECGIRNKDGVGFSITDVEHQEAQFGEFPWAVAILQFDSDFADHMYSCGGSLISSNAVLTAAHCVLSKDENSLLVRAGEWDLMTTNEVYDHQKRNVSRVIIHEHFNNKSMANDIAILVLEEPFTAQDHIQLACLPSQGTVFESDECFAVGWGKANFHAERYQAILKKLQFAIVPEGECQTALRTTRLGPKFRLHPSFICAGGQQGIDMCSGDGGSPLVCPVPGRDNKYYQAGIVSWGIGCGQEGVPGVYVKTSLYTDWINDKLRQIDTDVDNLNL